MIGMAELFTGLFTQGMVTHETYSRDQGGASAAVLQPEEIERNAQGAVSIMDRAPVDVGRVDQDVQVQEECRGPG